MKTKGSGSCIRKKGKEKGKSGDTVAERVCKSAVSVRADKPNLSECSFGSNAMHLKFQFFSGVGVGG